MYMCPVTSCAFVYVIFFFSSRRRHTRCALVTGVQTCALPIYRLLSLNQAPETDYVDADAVQREVAFARRMFADNGWSVIDVTRRSIEETAAAVIALVQPRDAQCV